MSVRDQPQVGKLEIDRETPPIDERDRLLSAMGITGRGGPRLIGLLIAVHRLADGEPYCDATRHEIASELGGVSWKTIQRAERDGERRFLLMVEPREQRFINDRDRRESEKRDRETVYRYRIDKEVRETYFSIDSPVFNAEDTSSSTVLNDGQLARESVRRPPPHTTSPHNGMGNGFLDPSETSKSKPIHPSRARIVWNRQLTLDDLVDLQVLEELFPRAVTAGFAQQTDRDWIAFVALAHYCHGEKKITNPIGLFTSILEGRANSTFDGDKPWQARPTDADTDWARTRINQAKPTAAGAVVSAAAMIGHPEEMRVNQAAACTEQSTDPHEYRIDNMARAEVRELIDWCAKKAPSKSKPLRDRVASLNYRVTPDTRKHLVEALKLREKEAKSEVPQ